jgi:23S rRNA (cytidine1920-2'-O)/16S rRNA (cytidine1409-2'-O)-methyltransferase
VARSRLDVELVRRGLFPSRARAQAAVMAGRVRMDGRVVDKPGTGVAEDADLEVERAAEFVSRGGVKLANALDALGVDVAGASALDLGASTGGFTDCLLSRGAARVIALDVGYGQLDWRLRQDPRVTVMERTNARHLRPGDLPWAPDLVTCDLSFISVGTVWGAVVPCLASGWRAMVMVKPQFEVGRGRVGAGGVVRDPRAREDAVRGVIEVIEATGGRVVGTADSGLPGPKGNREVFVYAEEAG